MPNYSITHNGIADNISIMGYIHTRFITNKAAHLHKQTH